MSIELRTTNVCVWMCMDYEENNFSDVLMALALVFGCCECMWSGSLLLFSCFASFLALHFSGINFMLTHFYSFFSENKNRVLLFFVFRLAAFVCVRESADGRRRFCTITELLYKSILWLLLFFYYRFICLCMCDFFLLLWVCCFLIIVHNSVEYVILLVCRSNLLKVFFSVFLFLLIWSVPPLCYCSIVCGFRFGFIFCVFICHLFCRGSIEKQSDICFGTGNISAHTQRHNDTTK